MGERNTSTANGTLDRCWAGSQMKDQVVSYVVGLDEALNGGGLRPVPIW